MPRYFLAICLGLCLNALQLAGQSDLRCVIADSLSRQGLPFATIKTGDKSIITGIQGGFVLRGISSGTQLTISYAGYRSRIILSGNIKNGDTIFLAPVIAAIGEVVVRPNNDKIRRIINTAVRNKSRHNPDLYALYQCDVYYKMKTDLVPAIKPVDSTKLDKVKKSKPDSGFNLLTGDNHILFSEVYSRRFYRRPQQLQENVIASRFSGLKKTYFTNLVTDVLPFHIYSDYISLNGKDYQNPVAAGWQGRYQFRLVDELIEGADTIYLLTFQPKKNTSFNSLVGRVYINSNGYAISHFTGTATDQSKDREVKIEQIYTFVDGKWFPRELNYQLSFFKYPLPELGLRMNGHSIIDSVKFVKTPEFKIDKAYPVKIGDSVDLHTESQWEQLRSEPISQKETNTYRIMDSLAEKAKIEQMVFALGKLGFGMVPMGQVDIELRRIVSNNRVENTRLGLGLYTNERLSEYFTVGGWFGYGLRDKEWKYGYSATFFPKKNKDTWIKFNYQKEYQSQGTVRLHDELDRTGFRNWILDRVDMVTEYSLKARKQLGYWEMLLGASDQKLNTRYLNNFEHLGENIRLFESQEATLALRYAYGEKRIPAFGYYLPSVTKYPIVYLRASVGKINGGNYKTNYLRASAAFTFRKHINRWGHDNFRAEAVLLHSFDDKPFSPSYLLAGNGFRSSGLNYYAWGGFLTMRPYELYSDRYVSFLYKHDFDKFLWQAKISKPYLSLAHNMLYGSIKSENRIANPGITTPVSGYHESGIMINQLLQQNIAHAINIYLNAGVFYHWENQSTWKKNGVWLIGLGVGF